MLREVARRADQLLGKLERLPGEVGLFSVRLRADRYILPRRHRHSTGGKPGRPGDQYGPGAWIGRCNTDDQRALHAPSASLAIPAAISLALFAQLVLVEAGLSQLAARIPPNRPLLAGLPVSAAITFAPLAQLVLAFAGTPQLLAFSTPHPDASRSNLNGLGKGRDRNDKKRRCRCGAERIFSHCLQHVLILESVCVSMNTGERDGTGVIASRYRHPWFAQTFMVSCRSPPRSARVDDGAVWNWFHDLERRLQVR
jgi:hypothetical protein